MHEEFIPPEKRGVAIARELFDWVESGLTAVLCVILVFSFAFRTVGVVGSSMLPTLEDNDRLVVTSLYSALQPEDIVVVTQPNSLHEPLIKRVIAVEGQTIDIDAETGEVYIDGNRINEDRYIREKIAPGSWYDMEFPQVVPRGCVFVMGDNRNNSRDSRFRDIGMIDARYVLGKVIFRVTPYERFGRPE